MAALEYETEIEAVCLLLSLKEQMYRIALCPNPELARLLALESTATVDRCLTLTGACAASPSGGAT